MSNLATRVWSGVVLGTLFLAVTLAGGIPFIIFVTIMACAFWAEWVDMKMPGADDRLQLAGIVALVGMAFVIFLVPSAWQLVALMAVIALFVAAIVGLRDRRALGGFLYSAALLASLTLLRGDWGYMPGLIAIIFLAAIVWCTDIGAYFVGRKIGGRKLAPSVSPNKTIAGAFGGLASAIVAALVIHLIFGIGSVGTAVGLAIGLSALSQAGDLFESWIKRRAGVKDSSMIIPGHGGVMDRADGLVFAAFGLWFMCVISVGMDEPARAFF